VTLGCAASLELGSFSFEVEVPGAARPFAMRDTRAVRIAEHTEATVHVRRVGVYDEGAIVFARAVSSDPGVFAIVRDDGRDHVAIRTALQGDATLDVAGPDGATDGVRIQVRPAAHVSVVADWSDVPREGGLLAAALAGEQVRLRVRTRDVEGEELVAEGQSIRAEPPERAEIVVPSIPHAVDVRFATRGRVSLAGEGGAPLLVEVIDPDDIEAVALEPADPAATTSDRLLLRPVVSLREPDGAEGARSILVRKHQLLSRRIELVSRTPEICEGRLTGETWGDETSVGFVEVSNYRSGKCVIEARVGEVSTTYEATRAILLKPG